MKIITGGVGHTDIDLLACAIAYKEFFDLQYIDSKAVIISKFNETIPNTVRNWNFKYETNFTDTAEEVILVDVSNPDVLPNFATKDNIKEVWDHRRGYEQYWQNLIEKHNIEIVGSCATLIWERFRELNLDNKISKISANLLYTAIISNTLNTKAMITHKRDINALNELKKHIDLPENWASIYYKETDYGINSNIEQAIKNDKKNVTINNKKYSIGQLELFSAKYVLSQKDIVLTAETVLKPDSDLWFLNIPCISEGKNYFITSSKEMQKKLSSKIDINFKNGIATCPQIMLRKEIMHILR